MVALDPAVSMRLGPIGPMAAPLRDLSTHLNALNTPAARAAIAPVLTAEERAAREMTDAQFYGWDALLGITPPPVAVNLTEQGACGGGGCAESYDNAQYWNMNAACSREVMGAVLFQGRRYRAAQIRLERLMANPPQAWVREMYFADTQDSLGRSTRLPTPPARESTAAKATQWADWCMEVSRCIAIARWASNISWCNGERTPDFYLGPLPPIGSPARGRRQVRTTSNFADPTSREASPGELGTVAATKGRDPRQIDVASTDVALGTYPPDMAWAQFSGWHPTGYFRGTSPRGSMPSRWTFGGDVPINDLLAGGDGLRRGVSEWHSSGSSDALRADSRAAFGSVQDGFDPYAPVGIVDRQDYTPTMIQFSQILRLRRGNRSGAGPFVLPSQRSDWDPVIAPSIKVGGGFLWPHGLRMPVSSSPRDALVALFLEARADTYNPADAAHRPYVAAALKFQINSNFSQVGGIHHLPTGLRQAWWLMAHAYDVIDHSIGHVVSNAFNNFLVGVNQIPNRFRIDTVGMSFARIGAENATRINEMITVAGSIAGAAIALGAAALGAASIPVAGWVVGLVTAVIAALVGLAALIASTALTNGLARLEPPPIMPPIVLRLAGVDDPTDPCWLVTSTPEANVPRATAVRDTAVGSGDTMAWYEQIRDRIASGEMPPPPTAPTINKGVAAGAGVIAGLALFKILGG